MSNRYRCSHEDTQNDPCAATGILQVFANTALLFEILSCDDKPAYGIIVKK